MKLKDRLGAIISDLVMQRDEDLHDSISQLRTIVDELPPEVDSPISGSAPAVAGKCPACGSKSLFLGKDGHVTCAIIHCPNPVMVDTWLYSDHTHDNQPEERMEDTNGAPLSARAQAVWVWWENISYQDFMAGAPKIGEYGAADLEIMGIVMEKWGLAAPEGGGGTEASILWYILGKVARAVAAYREGRAPSEDTLHDITYYSMMARRVRATGEWP